MALMDEWDNIESTVGGLGDSIGYLNKKNEDWANSIEGIKKQYEEAKG
jgi:archaellum component FlaC